MAGELTIINNPISPFDFIKNGPYLEFKLSGYDIGQTAWTMVQFKSPEIDVPYPANNGYLIFEFMGYTVSFKSLYGNQTELSKEPDTFMWYQSLERLETEFNAKIKNHYLLSKYYDISTRLRPSELTLYIECKKNMEGTMVNVIATGTRTGESPWIVAQQDGKAPNIPSNWKLWTKFVLLQDVNTRTETPEMFFDLGLENKVIVPFDIIKDYYTRIDTPQINEVFNAYTIWRNTSYVTCYYAEAYGDNFEVKLIKTTNNYLICNGEVNNAFYDQKKIDWRTENPDYLTIQNINSVIPWGMNSGETVRTFENMPQWLYLSSLNAILLTVKFNIEIMEKDGTKANVVKTLAIRGNSICRIPVSIKSLGIGNYDILQYIVNIYAQDNSLIFRRTYNLIEPPYNVRVFLLQNKYGLLESFYIDNLLEEKTVDGDIVKLSNDYKLDITDVESIYTARTGSKRIREIQLFKQASENQYNYIVQDNLLIPITLLSGSFEIADEEKDLQNIEFDFLVTKGAKPLPAKQTGGGYNGTSIAVRRPISGGTSQSLTAEISIMFNDNIIAGELSLITLKDSNNTSMSITPTIDGNTLYIIHDALQRETAYTVTIPKGSILNYYDDISWSFSTIGAIEVTELFPANNSNGNKITANVGVTFNQPIVGLDLTKIKITDSTGATVQILSTTINENSLTITHAGLKNSGTYTVLIPTGTIQDYNNDITWSFNTIEQVQIISLQPAYFSLDIEINTPVSVVFNQEVTTNNLSSVTILDQNNNPLDGVSAEIAGNIIYIHHPDFSYNNSYTIIIPSGSIIEYNELITWSFKTLVSPVIPLELVEIFPSGTSVPVNEPISVVFTKNISAIDLNLISIKNTNGDSINITAAINGNKIIITHDIFEYQSNYFGVIPAGTIQDYNEDINWEFRTIQNVEILSLSPINGAINIATNYPIIVTFNQKITALNLALITIKDSNNNPVSNVSGSIDDNTLEITHANFASETNYTVSIPSGTILGYNKDISWKFTSIKTQVEPPVVVRQYPIGANVAIIDAIFIDFDRNIEANNLSGITVSGLQITPHISNKRLSLNFLSLMQFNTTYVVNIPANSIKNYAQVINWSFRTQEQLQLIEVYPENKSSHVDINTQIVATFNRSVNINSPEEIKLYDKYYNEIQRDVSIENNQILITPYDAFDSDMKYTVVFRQGTFQDTNQEFSWSFSTGEFEENEYTEGYFALFDGINNSWEGHNPDIDKWIDLSGSGNEIALDRGVCDIGENCIMVSPDDPGTEPMFLDGLYYNGSPVSNIANFSIEVRFKVIPNQLNGRGFVVYMKNEYTGESIGICINGEGLEFYINGNFIDWGNYNEQVVTISFTSAQPEEKLNVYINGGYAGDFYASLDFFRILEGKIWLTQYDGGDLAGTTNLYSIRFYPFVLTESQIENNILVDEQKYS